ncbi:unnamed protein product, partial [Mesorhabditis belari]|uniref:Uncharacterized protein n=1 Tax=Mesorhabditis belari TaxID=2138241 RepID=A0AAF3EP57_9BILA
MTFGAKYYDLILVLLITLGLSSLLAVIQIFKLKSFTWPKTGFDISFKLSSQLTEIFDQNAEYAFFLGFPFAGLAAFYAATNNRLTIPVRLLSTAENANKFVQTLGYFPTFICELSLVFTCSKDLTYIFDRVSFYVDYYDLFSISQYCQLCISISRFMALSFDAAFINFLMCALDCMTYRNLKKRKKNGKTTRTEVLLMIQMISMSLIAFINSLLFPFLNLMINIFFGFNLAYTTIFVLNFFVNLLFYPFASIVSILFLRKRKERNSNGTSVTQSSLVDSRWTRRIYAFLLFIYSQYWSISEIKPDIDPSISGQLTPIIERTEAVVLVLSVFISFFAIWNVLWNDRLTLPLRLLAANENVDKMIFAIIYTYYCVCAYLANDQCPQAIFDLITTINSYVDYHILNDIAQYNQLMISISSADKSQCLIMMANSFLTLINTLFMYSIMSIVNFFFDISLAFLVMRSLDFIRFFFFNFIMSLISVFCFRKPRDQKVHQRTNDGTAFTVSRRTTRNR